MPIITLSLNTEHTIAGTQLDALALSCGLWQDDDCFSNNLDYLDEYMTYAFKEINHEMALITLLNEYGKGEGWLHDEEEMGNLPVEFLIHLSLASDDYCGNKTPLMFGAWYALNQANAFSNLLAAFTELMEEKEGAFLGDYSHMPEPYETELTKAYKSAEEQMRDEYLYGDRSNPGMIDQASRKIFDGYRAISFSCDSDKWDTTISLDYNQEDMAEFLEYKGLVEQGETPNEMEIKKIIEDYLCNKKDDVYHENKRKSEAYKAEREATRKYQEEREAKKRAERTALLEAMTK